MRIWGNYLTECYVGVACASVSIGPLYVWRNVSNVMRVAPGQWRGGFLKTSDKLGGGRIFVFHNTILQPPAPAGDPGTAGAELGLGHGGPMVNVVSRNNILHVTRTAIRRQNNDSQSDYDYDLYTGQSAIPAGQETHGIKGVPTYVRGSGLRDGKGLFALSPISPGYDAGVRLPNFNDDYTGQAPDLGAHEMGTPEMEFGVNAHQPPKPASSEGTADASAARHCIQPGEVWPDDRGRHIQAHGGGVIKLGDTFYWFGEDRARDNERGKRYVSCYSSKNLMDWTFRNQVLKLADPENFGPTWVLERPKVFYNAKTKLYVMYMHIDGPLPGERGADISWPGWG